MKVLAVCHKTEGDLGVFRDVLDTRGADLDIVIGYEDKLPEIDPLAHDVAIVMGGAMGVYEAEDYPYLYSEIKYLEGRVANDRPTLGVCLGAQLMAASQGQKVYKGEEGPETGWREISINETGANTVLRHLDKSHTKMFQGHQDTFDMPTNATLLASSDMYEKQAYKIGDKCWALQFHPEVNHSTIEFWLATSRTYFENSGNPPKKMRDDTEKYATQANKQTTLFFNEWLDEVL